jgi:hypothetical protein
MIYPQESQGIKIVQLKGSIFSLRLYVSVEKN